MELNMSFLPVLYALLGLGATILLGKVARSKFFAIKAQREKYTRFLRIARKIERIQKTVRCEGKPFLRQNIVGGVIGIATDEDCQAAHTIFLKQVEGGAIKTYHRIILKVLPTFTFYTSTKFARVVHVGNQHHCDLIHYELATLIVGEDLDWYRQMYNDCNLGVSTIGGFDSFKQLRGSPSIDGLFADLFENYKEDGTLFVPFAGGNDEENEENMKLYGKETLQSAQEYLRAKVPDFRKRIGLD
jgi:hypothetical protein